MTQKKMRVTTDQYYNLETNSSRKSAELEATIASQVWAVRSVIGIVVKRRAHARCFKHLHTFWFTVGSKIFFLSGILQEMSVSMSTLKHS